MVGWTLLGLRLGVRPPGGRILGWRIRRSTPDLVLLGAGSLVGLPAELLFLRQPDGLLFATFVRQQSRYAGPVAAGRAQSPADRALAAGRRRSAGQLTAVSRPPGRAS
jgi:hypothetical protein